MLLWTLSEKKNINRERDSLIITHTYSVTRVHERERSFWDKRETTTVKRSSLCFWVLLLVLILSLRKFWGFLLYGFPEENLCSLSNVIDWCACCSLR